MSAIIGHTCGHTEPYTGLSPDDCTRYATEPCTRCMLDAANDSRHQLRDNLRRLAEFVAEPYAAWGLTREQARALITDSIRIVEALP